MKKSTIIVLLILVSLITLLAPILADPGDDDSAHHEGCFGGTGAISGMGNMMYGTYGTGLGIFNWITGLLIISILILLAVFLFKQIQKK